MRKETVETFLTKLERQSSRVKNNELRQAQVAAIDACRMLLQLRWVDMAAPVTAKLVMLTTETRPLLEKEDQQQPLTEEEAACLQAVRNVYGIYYQFQQRISPTVTRARREQDVREREKARQRGQGEAVFLSPPYACMEEPRIKRGGGMIDENL